MITQQEFLNDLLERILDFNCALILESGMLSELISDCIFYITYYLLFPGKKSSKAPIISNTCEKKLLEFFREQISFVFGEGITEKYLLGEYKPC